MTIRRAMTEDAAAIARLSGELGYRVSVDGTRDRLGRILASVEDRVFVAELANRRVVGWIHAFVALRLESEDFAEIGGFVVSETCRGSGVGTKLLAAVEQWAVARSLPVLRVRSQSKRLEARRFYRNRGFTETKEQRVLDKVLASGTLRNSCWRNGDV